MDYLGPGQRSVSQHQGDNGVAGLRVNFLKAEHLLQSLSFPSSVCGPLLGSLGSTAGST